jgi:hypothetical protein
MIDALGAVVSPPSEGMIDEMVEAFAPPTDLIEIELPWGARLSFRAIVDRVEFRRLQRGARDFAHIRPESAPNPECASFFDTDPETKAIAFALAQTSVQPKFTPLDMLRLAKQAVLGFEFIKDAFNAAQSGSLRRAETAGIEALKNASGETPQGETA